MLNSYEKIADDFWNQHDGCPVYIGCSGGVDSVVLAHVLARYKPKSAILVLIHIDHAWSPKSVEYAQFVEQLSKQLALPFLSARVECDLDKNREASARLARHRAFADLTKKSPGPIVLGHHQDDQAETILMRLLRGSGPFGLRGLQYNSIVDGLQFIRPFLSLSRADIEKYAAENTLSYLTDPSNTDTTLDRNWLRSDVIPLLKNRYPALNQRLETAALGAKYTVDLLRDFAPVKSNYLDICSVSSNTTKTSLLYHWLLEQGANQLNGRFVRHVTYQITASPNAPQEFPAADFFEADTVLTYYRRILRLENKAARDLVTDHSSLITALEAQVLVENSRYTLELMENIDEQSSNTLFSLINAEHSIDLKKVNVPLILKNLPPDAKIPLGKAGHQSLRKFAQSHHIPPWWRMSLPALYTENHQFVAIANGFVAPNFRDLKPGIQFILKEKKS